MRRPLLYAAAAYVAAILAAYYTEKIITFIPALILLMILVFGRGLHQRVVVLMLIFYLVSLLNFSFHQAMTDEAALYAGHMVTVKGKVIHIENKENAQGQAYTQLKLDADTINKDRLDHESRILIKYYLDEPSVSESSEGEPVGNKSDTEEESGDNECSNDILPRNTVIVKGKIELPPGRRNPGCFDYALYLKSIGISTTMTASKIMITAEESIGLSGKLYQIKENFLSSMKKSVGKETSGLMRAIMFGEKSELEEDTLEEFQKNGTAHILAVSGLHIGIIYGFICMIWRWKKGKLFFILVMLFFCCYMILAAFSPSVVRAVIMVGLHMFSRLTNRRYDLSSAAFFVVLAMLFKNPLQIFNVGFQMSFLAVLTLDLFLPIIKRIYSGVFLGSAAIQLGMLPYTAYVFNYLPMGAVFINLPVIFITGLLVPLGLCSMVFMGISQQSFDLISGIIFGLSEMLQYINSMTGIDGITVFAVTSPDIKLLTFYYLCLLIFLSEEGRLMILRKKKKMICFCLAAIIAAAAAFGAVIDDGFGDSDIVFVDVGQGDCMHVKTATGANYLIDGGGSMSYNVGKKTLKPYLLKNGIKKVDGAFVTHIHTDHYQGIAELCREGMVDKLFLYEENRVKEKQLLKETGLAKEDLVYLCKGQQVALGSNAAAEILWPQRQGQGQYLKMAADETDENLCSLIIKITVDDGSMIATGDVDEACEDELTEAWGNRLKTDVLKVAHHGSKYSYSHKFADMTSPGYAVFQVGKNNFGHPNQEIIKNYALAGAEICRTDLQGAIGFEFEEGRKIQIKKMIENNEIAKGGQK